MTTKKQSAKKLKKSKKTSLTKKIKQKLITVKNLNHLKTLTTKNNNKYFITLNYGLISRKNIQYNKKTKKFKIFNYIDETTIDLTPKQLMQQTWTNIGQAIKKKALICELN